jgi:hypothetical protein
MLHALSALLSKRFELLAIFPLCALPFALCSFFARFQLLALYRFHLSAFNFEP